MSGHNFRKRINTFCVIVRIQFVFYTRFEMCVDFLLCILHDIYDDDEYIIRENIENFKSFAADDVTRARLCAWLNCGDIFSFIVCGFFIIYSSDI